MDSSSEKPASTLNAKPPVPWWGWVCAGLCVLIPIVTLGGALPGGIGLGGAGVCVAASRHAETRLGVRVAICVGTVVVCWVLVAVLLVVWARMQK